MGKILNKFYARHSNPGIIEIITGRSLTVDWAIEAGCHDGSDTIGIANLENMRQIYSFEPDVVAASKAQAQFKILPPIVKFFPIALWDKSGFVEMHSPNGKPGDGSSIFRFCEVTHLAAGMIEEQNFFLCTTIDAEVTPISDNGMLWLDVEGVSNIVLNGALQTLKSISIAQIEIEMHKMSNRREESFDSVHRIMTKLNFRLFRAPLHPGYFGDVIYIKKENLTNSEKVFSSYITILMFILHKIIYPTISKPAPENSSDAR